MENSAENSGEKLTANPKFAVLLARMPEFAYLGTDELTRLSLLTPRIYKSGEVLLDCSAADKNNMVILLAGFCDIEKSIEVGTISARICVNKVHAPAVFGEVGVFASRSRTATVVAAQRVVALVVSENEFAKMFEGSDAAFNNTLWSFAKLGLKRCRITADSYISITDRVFHGNVIDHSVIESQIAKLETLSKNARDDVRPDKSLFNETGDCLEWLDSVFALASYFGLIPDFTMPPVRSGDVPSSIVICPLARQALEKSEPGKSVKLALADIMLEKLKGQVAHEDQIAFFKGIIQAADDLLAVLPYSGWASEALPNLPEAAKVIEDLSGDINKELDVISDKAVERFGLPMFPASVQEVGEEARPRLVSYVCQKIDGVKALLPAEEAFKKYAKYPDRSGEEVKNNLALAIFTSMKYHPVMRFIMEAKCPPTGDQKCPGIFGSAQLMSGFFCMGCRMAARPAPDRAKV